MHSPSTVTKLLATRKGLAIHTHTHTHAKNTLTYMHDAIYVALVVECLRPWEYSTHHKIYEHCVNVLKFYAILWLLLFKLGNRVTLQDSAEVRIFMHRVLNFVIPSTETMKLAAFIIV